MRGGYEIKYIIVAIILLLFVLVSERVSVIKINAMHRVSIFCHFVSYPLPFYYIITGISRSRPTKMGKGMNN
jgi:hypothetical protein